MEFKNLLIKKRPSVVRKWFDLIIDTYHPETAKFLRAQKDPFANPVGQTILRSVEGLFDELTEGERPARVSELLDGIIRIRAVQDFTASEAVAFVFGLKRVIREELSEEAAGGALYEEIFGFESGLDKVALEAFDIYVGCREKIYDLKSTELRRNTFRLAEMVNRMDGGREIPGEGETTN